MGEIGNPRQWVFNQIEGNAWVRNKEWKLYRDGKLFDMLKDPKEQLPIHPEKDSQDTRVIRETLQRVFNTLYNSH
jgi:hypothetical protein